MISLKITRIGNSLGVVLPKEALHELNVSLGDVLMLTKSPDGYRLTPYEETLAEEIEAGRRIMKKRRNALHELAK